MCTITVAVDSLADSPLAIAANRDECLDRPASPPAPRSGSTAWFGPRDQSAGGTWIGLNEHGLSVAITNRWLDDELDGDRSRGLLVRDCLGTDSADSALRTAEAELAERDYAGFNLLVGDATQATVLEWDGTALITPLDSGIHVVTNVGIDEQADIPPDRWDAGLGQVTGARQLRRALYPEPEEPASSWLDRAGALLGDHDVGVCVHGDGFGTRSSSLLAVLDDGPPIYRHADGPPCKTTYEPQSVRFD